MLSKKKNACREVTRLLKCADWGLPMRCHDLKMVVKSYIDMLGKRGSLKKLKNNTPGSNWVKLFLMRNHVLTLRLGENIKSVLAAVSSSILILTLIT